MIPTSARAPKPFSSRWRKVAVTAIALAALLVRVNATSPSASALGGGGKLPPSMTGPGKQPVYPSMRCTKANPDGIRGCTVLNTSRADQAEGLAALYTESISFEPNFPHGSLHQASIQVDQHTWMQGLHYEYWLLRGQQYFAWTVPSMHPVACARGVTFLYVPFASWVTVNTGIESAYSRDQGPTSDRFSDVGPGTEHVYGQNEALAKVTRASCE